jgi:TatA/E family protein of Tat protein translocase
LEFFGMGPMELLVIVTIAFIIFGPEKLTEIMGGLGRAVREFRAMTSDLTGEFERTMSEVRETAEELQSTTREALTVEGLNPFDQPTSPAAIASHNAMSDNGSAPQATATAPAVMRPARSHGPAPTKADPLADFAIFGEPAPAPTPPVAVAAEPLADGASDAAPTGEQSEGEVSAPVVETPEAESTITASTVAAAEPSHAQSSSLNGVDAV